VHTKLAQTAAADLVFDPNRRVNDILIAVVDGLKGFPEAITAVFPQTQVSMRAMDQAERECSNEDDVKLEKMQ